ncbi:MAG: hypothetical protein JWR69_988 [Pedosphaera sp.]|nr:hypothetical protein [Pedosphaera sp.]
MILLILFFLGWDSIDLPVLWTFGMRTVGTWGGVGDVLFQI